MAEQAAARTLRLADWIRNRHRRGNMAPFRGGPETWSSLYQAAGELAAWPAAEAARRHLGLTQLQFWDETDPAAAADALQAAADSVGGLFGAAEHPDVVVLRRELDETRRLLVEALGYRSAVDYTLGQLVIDVASIRRRVDLADQRANQRRRRPPPQAPGGEEPAASGGGVVDLTGIRGGGR
jgi:hypothetical protein